MAISAPNYNLLVISVLCLYCVSVCSKTHTLVFISVQSIGLAFLMVESTTKVYYSFIGMQSDRYESSYQGTSISYQFNTYQLALAEEAEMMQSDNPFALAVLVGRSAFVGKRAGDSQEQDTELLEFKGRLLRNGFTDEQAAKAAQVSIEFVQKIRVELNKKK